MTKATPEQNQLQLEKLRGRMDTFEATVEGQMNLQTNNIENMKESSIRIEDSVKRISSHCTTLYTRQDEAGVKAAALEGVVRGHTKICEERDRTIRTQIETGFTNMTDKIQAEEKHDDKDDANKKWRYSLYLTILIAIAGWLFVAFN